MTHVKPWVFGTRWLQDMLITFGMLTVPPAPERTPQQIATDTLAVTQRELLAAKLVLEEADAQVSLLVKRSTRLRQEITTMNNEADAGA